MYDGSWSKRVRIGGRIINNLRHADDDTLLTGDEDELMTMLSNVNQASSTAGLLLNVKKTKVMSTADKESIKTGQDHIESVKRFVLLGSRIESDGDCKEEIKRRLSLGRVALTGLDKIWKNETIKISTTERLVRALVFPVVMYRCETWTMKMEDRRRVLTMEMW